MSDIHFDSATPSVQDIAERAGKLVEKVLHELRHEVKSRCRHSDENYTVVAYVCHERRTGVEPFLRVDIFKRKKRKGEGESSSEADAQRVKKL